MNKLPNGWEEKRLDDLFKEFTEKNHADKNILASTQDRGVIPSDLLDRHIIRKKESLSNYKLVKKGCFVISLRSFQGGFEYSNYEGIISPAYTILEPKMKLVDDFYKYYFKSYYFINKSLPKYAEGIRDGKQIKYKACKEILVPYPPLDEQKRIASALSKIDAYLENTIKLIEEKERFKRGIAKKLLTCKEGENIPEARFKGFEGEWEIVKLGDITKMISGGTPNTKIKEYYNGNIVWATITDITNSYKYLYDSEKKITELGLQNSSTKIFPINTVLYSIYGSIGECAISKVECTTNQAILGIECSDKINYNFLYYLLSNHKNNAKKLRQFGTQPNINKKIVLNFCFKIPNIEEQEKIGGYLSLLDAEIDNLKKQKELIKEMKKGAMQKLLSGEIRLSKNAFNENI